VNATFVELFAVINQVTGSRVPLRPLPSLLFRLPARLGVAWAAMTGEEPGITPESVAIVVVRARVTSRRAEQELGYRPAPLRTMIEDSYCWLLAEGLLKAG
jgi:hypothetical protein